MILTGQQSICCHVMLHIIPVCDLFSTKSKTMFYFLIKNFILLVSSHFQCSFCNLCDETPFHIFYECDRVKCLWSGLLSKYLTTLTPQIVISYVCPEKKVHK